MNSVSGLAHATFRKHASTLVYFTDGNHRLRRWIKCLALGKVEESCSQTLQLTLYYWSWHEIPQTVFALKRNFEHTQYSLSVFFTLLLAINYTRFSVWKENIFGSKFCNLRNISLLWHSVNFANREEIFIRATSVKHCDWNILIRNVS